MKRFTMTNKMVDNLKAESKNSSLQDLDHAWKLYFAGESNVRFDTIANPKFRRRIISFSAEPEYVSQILQQVSPGIIVEPEIEIDTPTESIVLSTSVDIVLPAPAHFASIQVAVVTQSSFLPIKNARVSVYFNELTEQCKAVSGFTDSAGLITLHYNTACTPRTIMVIPSATHWSMFAAASLAMQFDLPALPLETLGWWHRAMGIQEEDPRRGEGVRIGVIDTGFGPHADLLHVSNAGAFLGGIRHQDGKDTSNHGTHVCGIIGARPTTNQGYSGIAPGAEITSVRVAPPNGGGILPGDVMNAIDFLAHEKEVDLINMSLNFPTGTDHSSTRGIADAIEAAQKNGVLTFVSAGDARGRVLYPAQASSPIAVSSVGRKGWAPLGSLAAGQQQGTGDLGYDGQFDYFLAWNSGFGPEIDCCAPGVGIISTVPSFDGLDAPYAVMNGASMASPAACGLMAVILARTPEYMALPRGQERTDMARALLEDNCVPAGLAPECEGWGIPFLIVP